MDEAVIHYADGEEQRLDDVREIERDERYEVYRVKRTNGLNLEIPADQVKRFEYDGVIMNG